MKPPLKQGNPNDFQTPPEALKPLLPYLPKDWTIWECACGKMYLADEFKRLGYDVEVSDTLYGEEQDFMTYKPAQWDCIVTNPPFSYKQEFLQRAYELGTPFAFLLPLTTFETAKRQELFDRYGVEVVFFDKRINFETPNKVEKSSSWFATAWFTYGLNIGKQLSFAKLEL